MALRWTWSFGAAALITAAGWAGGCGSSNHFADDTAVDSGTGGDGSSGFDGSLFGGDTGTQTLTIDPVGPTLDVTAPGTPLQFTAKVNGQAVQANWTIDVALIGTIDGNGLFKASAVLGGTTTVTAQSGSLKAQTPLTVKLHITDNTGNIPGGTIIQLDGGGSADPNFKWLYPYNATVFPRGLLPPTLQYATAADAVRVHVSFAGLDYKGYYAGTSSRVALTPALWNTITESAGSSDKVHVEITKIQGGQVTGPTGEDWSIAQGSLKGTVYYNSYSSQLAGNTGAVMRIKPGAATPDVLIGGCNVCHAVSADGSTLVASHSNYVSGASYDLKNSAAVIHDQSADAAFSFGGLYPDGHMLMSNAALNGSWPPNVPGQEGPNLPRASRLYDTKTGAIIPAPGWDNVITYAITPAFSPDGKRIAFNKYDATAGHTFSVMDFNAATNTFSNLVDVASDPTNFLAWPAFLPDSNWVIFHSDSRADYASWQGAKADLMIAHVPSKTVVRLDAVDGYDPTGKLYLPYGATEATLNYEPTMLPVAVGGYYWVVFTSRREYGNIITDPGQDTTPRKKLWIAAIDIDSPEHPLTKAKDLSHPAFYLEGQELPSGNMRGFWALDPCKQNGNNCQTGDECCSGFCRQTTVDGGLVFACVPPPSGCAQEFEKCNVAADCCGAASGYLCLNGHCAKPAPK